MFYKHPPEGAVTMGAIWFGCITMFILETIWDCKAERGNLLGEKHLKLSHTATFFKTNEKSSCYRDNAEEETKINGLCWQGIYQTAG